MLYRLILRLFICLSLLSSNMTVAKSINIKVGAYEFPPFFETLQGQPSGITPLLVDAFNQIQSEYTFELVVTSPKRRYIDFERDRIQMLFFEDPKWGWKGYPVVTSKTFLHGGEVFIAKKKKGRDDTFFSDLKQRRIAAMLGYHYKFADWNSDVEFLKKQFDIRLLSHANTIIKQVIKGKADIGIVSKAFLDRELYRKHELNNLLIISDFYDQRYNHRVMLAEDSVIDIETINTILKDLYHSGELEKIFNTFGLSPAQF